MTISFLPKDKTNLRLQGRRIRKSSDEYRSKESYVCIFCTYCNHCGNLLDVSSWTGEVSKRVLVSSLSCPCGGTKDRELIPCFCMTIPEAIEYSSLKIKETLFQIPVTENVLPGSSIRG